MKKRLIVFFSYLFFWYCLFFSARLLFLIFYHNQASQLSFTEMVKTFVYGFRLDIAIAAYISFLPSLALSVGVFFNNKPVKVFFHLFTFLALLFCLTIISGDIFMYRHWGFRLDATPLLYMSNIKAMTASVSSFTLATGVLIVLILTGIIFRTYYKVFNADLKSFQRNSKAIWVILPLTMALFVLMRGGIGISSLNTSSAYFSKNKFANHAAINPVWNVGFSITESGDLNRKYEFFSEPEMNKYLAPLHPEKDSTTYLLDTNRPNIILIITESLTAKALEATGANTEIMPELNALIKEGILFNQIYSSSDRTDKGIAAVLAGYPSLPGSTPLKYQRLTEKIAMLPAKLNAGGYKSEFYYGGTLEFANYKSFLVQAGYDKMVSDKDFPSSELKSKWGAFDHVVLNRCLKDSPDDQGLFFKTILTLTSHEPFEIPDPPAFDGNDVETKFLNSLHYTDKCLGDFIREAKKRKWWDNTLVIIIADHGSRLPGNSEIDHREKYHIPMIWLGGALKVKDSVITQMASQTDLAATLCSQLNIGHSDFNFSNNILNRYFVPYSFFTFSGGFGFLKPDQLLIYNTVTNTFSNSDSIVSPDKNQGKAYLQSIYKDFRSKNN